MNQKNQEIIARQLTEAGASEIEAKELSVLANTVSMIYDFKRSKEFKNKFLNNIVERLE